jgi:hypothetical protein
MLQSRPGFLIGAGAVLTTAFVRDAREFVHATGKPLLVKQSEARHTLYWYLPRGSNAPLLCLDGSPFIVPPPPTWREFIRGLCTRLYARQPRPEDIDMWRRHYDVEPDQLDLPVDPAVWQGEQDRVLSPQAQAYALLQGIHFGPDLDRSYHLDRSYYRAGGHPRPHIQFRWTGGDRFTRWVTASDLVALSLLQARLMDLRMPIKILEGDWCGDTIVNLEFRQAMSPVGWQGEPDVFNSFLGEAAHA